MNEPYAPRPLWFWNDLPTKESITQIMENCSRRDGYGGFGILPYRECRLQYMSEEYLDLYGFVLQEAKRLDLKICLYDEWWFPSGSAGGILKERFPDALAKRLDLEEYAAEDTRFCISLPTDGKIMALVAMKGHQRTDVSGYVCDGTLRWDAPDKGYRILCFILRHAGLNRVDYLDPDAVKKFITCTHEVYYKRFSEYFGSVIDSAFYDEPQFYSARGRAWTEGFNRAFFEKYGEPASLFYPALYYDIGEETAEARDKLLALRAELYANGFPKIIQQWCRAHKISLTGHVDQEEAENPCGITGDLMTSFRYQDIPGIDEIFTEGRAGAAYKLVSSAAVNWNHEKVMCECFGAIENITEDAIYRESYDLFTKGINLLVPHAVWQNPSSERVKFKPELSYRTEYYAKLLPQYNAYCSFLQEKLQTGGQVNTLAVIYPIESLRYLYRFSWDGDPVSGGPTWENNNYMKLGQYLSQNVCRDFTFLHPDVLNEGCRVENGVISMESHLHDQRYHTVILPGMKIMSLHTATRLLHFVRGGGTLISIGELPTMATRTSENGALRNVLRELFGEACITDTVMRRQCGKGSCHVLPFEKRDFLRDILRDVTADTKILNPTHGLQYIHKRNGVGDVWYFAAIRQDVDTRVVLDGEYLLTMTDPKTRVPHSLAFTHENGKTVFRLILKKESSAVIEGKRANAAVPQIC